MSDNPQYGSDGLVALPEYRVLALTGPDAIAFAQAQFMNDVAALDDGRWQWNGWLGPKGRVQALFALIRIDGLTLWLVCCGDVAVFEQALGRFRFRSKVQIDLLDMHASGRFASPAAARANCAEIGTDGAVELDMSGDAGPRTLVLASTSAGATEGADAPNDWWAADIAHGWPAIPGARLEDWTPQQLSLERLDAFSVRKGCYPGQEIVARTHFLGRAKRGVRQLLGEDMQAGSVVSGPDGADVGRVVCAAGRRGLAVLPLDLDAGAGLTVGGSPTAIGPLAGGLAR